MSALGRPAHLLLLDHALADDLVDGGLDERTGDRLATSVAFAIIWDPRAVGPNVARELGDHLELWGGKTSDEVIGDAEGGFEFVWLLFTTVLTWARPRQDLVLENLLLRHQLAVLTRPTRTRPRARLRIWDKLVWILARRFCGHWREHLAFVTPDTVVRWHRQGVAPLLALEVPLRRRSPAPQPRGARPD